MKTLTTTILTLGICLAGLHRASGVAQLRISDGTPEGTIIITDDDANDLVNTTPGMIIYVGPVVTNWTVNVTSGTSKPIEGGATTPVMDVGTQNSSLDAGTLTVEWSDTDFTAGGPADVAIDAVTDGTVTYRAWTDPANTNFGKKNLVGTIGPSTDVSFTTDTNGFVPQMSPYSITLETVIQHSGPGTTAFDAVIVVTPPSCLCALTFNSPASITNCAGDAIPDVVASQDCGNGSTNVPVTVIGAVTNGICPQIITRTNMAFDSCGNTYMFVQTVTINCPADCTITTSVPSAIQQTIGVTASVADAGVGAMYNWTVLNGTITTGQGTPNITITAGTDTNSPMSIIVVVTAATGCQSTCSASVQVTPQPPAISLGKGDTAEIGFWHNKNGQALINAAPNSLALANWLASNFPCMYGNLAGKPNSAVASSFLQDFGVKGQKTSAQVLAGALSAFFTSSTLAGNNAANYGFNVTPGGAGQKSFNVGKLGTTIGLQNNTSYSVFQILQAANSNCPFSPAVSNALNTIFEGINSAGNIH